MFSRQERRNLFVDNGANDGDELPQKQHDFMSPCPVGDTGRGGLLVRKSQLSPLCCRCKASDGLGGIRRYLRHREGRGHGASEVKRVIRLPLTLTLVKITVGVFVGTLCIVGHVRACISATSY
jgi:hypothetical protein